MSTATITVDQNGANHVSIDGAPAKRAGTGADAQAAAMDIVRQHAARSQQTVALHVIDQDGSAFHLNVAPDGQVWTAPEPSPMSPDVSTDIAPLTVPRVDQAPAAEEDSDRGLQGEEAPIGARTEAFPVDQSTAPVHEPERPVDLEVSQGRSPANAPLAKPQAGPEPAPASARVDDSIDAWKVSEPSIATDYPDPAPEAVPAAPDVTQDPRWEAMAAEPATQGARGTLNRALGMKLSPTPAELDERRAALATMIQADEVTAAAAREEEARAAETARQQSRRAQEREQRAREQRTAIQSHFQRPVTVVICNPKGGSVKTTTTNILAATLGMIRGGGIIAWDANETMGNLGERSHQAAHDLTVVDLLEDAERFATVEGSRLGALDRFVRPQGDSHFDVLASDEDPTHQDLVDGAGFDAIHEILTRFYRMVLIDTGNNIRVEHFRAAIDQADLLVIPVAAARDSARGARAMMASLTDSGHGDLVRNAVVLIHDREPRSAADDRYLETTRAVAAEFEGRVAAVVPVPFDPALKDGDVIEHDNLQPATTRAYQEAAAHVATGIATRAR